GGCCDACSNRLRFIDRQMACKMRAKCELPRSRAAREHRCRHRRRGWCGLRLSSRDQRIDERFNNRRRTDTRDFERIFAGETRRPRHPVRDRGQRTTRKLCANAPNSAHVKRLLKHRLCRTTRCRPADAHQRTRTAAWWRRDRDDRLTHVHRPFGRRRSESRRFSSARASACS
ncbi:MAG: hypothetical protein RL591_785, partial [Planctomycetota bacterium]